MLNKLFSALLTSFLGASLLNVSKPILRTTELIKTPAPTVRLLAFGDLMLGRDIERLMQQEGNDYPFRQIFGKSGIEESDYDLMMANLEGPIVTAKKRPDLKPFFAFKPEVVPKLLKNYGFDLLNLANNHTWDHGVAGWESSLRSLHEHGINTIGHPKNMIFDSDILETEIKGIKIAFLGINDTNFKVDWEAFKSKIKELDHRNDFVIINIHWGQEYQNSPNLHQRDKAHGIIDSGADLIIGHHPHVIQAVEWYKGRAIYYSLGNFVFDQYFSDAVQKGLAIAITLKKSGKLNSKEIPIQLTKGQPSKIQS